MAIRKHHILPEDLAGGAIGDVAWFGRYSPFLQAETRRQVAYKRREWPELPDGEHSKHPGYLYPHLLPADRWTLNLFEPIRSALAAYLNEYDIALHSEAANLRGSQACCFNFLFPLRRDLDAATVVLGAVLPGVDRVLSIDFEDTGADGATEWLGEAAGGKRGQMRTSIDAAVRWRDRDGRTLVTLVEWKYTEEAYGVCGGYASKGNRNRERCETLDLHVEPAARCYLASGTSAQHRRRYWEHVRPAVLQRLASASGCPFQGPLYQLLRQELLADHYRATGDFDAVDVVAIHFTGNVALSDVPVHLRKLGRSVGSIWSTAIGTGFREIAVEKLMAAFDAAPVERTQGWRAWRVYLRHRYGV